MMVFMERVAAVKVALTATIGEIDTTDAMIGPQFQLAVALAEMVKNDPGASVASRDTASEVMDAVEKALKTAAVRARGVHTPKAKKLRARATA